MSARNTLRRLVVGGVDYRWRVAHAHNVLPPAAPGRGRCCEVFTAFVEGHRTAPLIVRFFDGPHRGAGYPQAGVVWAGSLEANLNLPSIARRLITLARAEGWSPETGRRGLEIADGFRLLPALAARAPGV